MAFGPAQALGDVSFTGWTNVILGVVWIAVGGALLSLRPWAWLFCAIVVGFSLLVAFFGNLSGWQFGDLFVAMIVPLVILFYLTSDNVRRAFGMQDE